MLLILPPRAQCKLMHAARCVPLARSVRKIRLFSVATLRDEELSDSAAPLVSSTLLVAPSWLAAQSPESVTIIDASWYMPAAKRDTRAEYIQHRIPGAAFFDIDAVVDRTNPAPHMLPPIDVWATAAAELGIRHSVPVVCYDSAGLLSAARARWTLRAFGHERVALLHGGLPRWVAEGLPTGSGEPHILSARVEHWELNKEIVSTLQQVQTRTPSTVVIDARPAGRFEGRDPEPRAGVAGGHIPGSCSLPFTDLLDEANYRTFLPTAQLRAALIRAGVDLHAAGNTFITTCGSGVTAAVLALALQLAGIAESRISVYDGSWSEWGAHPTTIKEVGPSAAALLKRG